jgi:hypothetical protein
MSLGRTSRARTNPGVMSGATIRRVGVSVDRAMIVAGRVAVVDFSHGRAVADVEVHEASASGR